MGRPRSGHMTWLILTMLLVLPLIGMSSDGGWEDSGPETPPSRSLVTIPKEHLNIVSGGISQWGPYCFGVVNRTTLIEMKLKNTADAPFSGIKVNLTLYWYDAHKGFSFDKGRILFRDQAEVDIGPGDGTLSRKITFEWTPRFAGAYVMNITIKLPGDPRPYTNRTLIAGLQYTLDKKTITDGLWVGTNTWNGSSMDGWSEDTEQGEEGIHWHVAEHPLAKGYETLHTPDKAFWVGNDSSGLSPTSGVYSLISPPIDLTGFNPDPWDSFLGKTRPQIYLLYKYRGNLSSESISGGSGIYHWIRYRENGNWSNWKPLLDPKGDWVNISGNTTNVIWDLSKRPFLQGDLEFIGVDLGDHQGKTVQIKFEYHPSGYPETGYVIDDIMVIGKETVDIEPFSISSYTEEIHRSNPGEEIEFDIGILCKLKETEDKVPVRIDVVDGSDFLDLSRDIRIRPSLIDLAGGACGPYQVDITLSIPSSSPSGEGWFKVRVIGGGTLKDVTFRFIVETRRSLDLSVEGDRTGIIQPGEYMDLGIHVTNKGNVEELVYLNFITGSDLDLFGQLGSFDLQPGEHRSFMIGLTVPEGSLAGSKRGFILLTGSPPPADAIEKLLDNRSSPGWYYVEVNYSVEQVHDIEIIEPSPSATYREIEDPPDNGSVRKDYNLIIANHGNSRDKVSFSVQGWDEREDIVLHLPENIPIEPGATRFVEIQVEVTFPVPFGIYDFDIMAFSSDDETTSSNVVTLTLSVGGAPVSSGIYMVNGSLDLQPSRTVFGQEVVISFTVKSFGFLDKDSFNVNLWLNDAVVQTRPFQISRYQDKVCQMTWSFGNPGLYRMMVSLSEWKEPASDTAGLVRSLHREVRVGFIDMGITALELHLESGEDIGERPLPGIYECTITVTNRGNTTADLSILTLNIEDPVSKAGWNLTMNVTEMVPGESRNLTFKNIELLQERDYQFSAFIDSNGRWRDMNSTDDLRQLRVKVGSVPPEVPFWRDPVWGILGFILTLIVTIGLLFYLLRKKF
ncbi:MAG: hypothetical protein ACMUHY_07095 [Thermoplasmatota archaeon]